MKIGAELKNIPLSYRQLYEDLSIIAVLHDIGRDMLLKARVRAYSNLQNKTKKLNRWV